MGYDLNRFITEVDEEFICPICTMVLENGVQSQHCEHIYCDNCIKEWLNVNKSCPIDRKDLFLEEIKPIPRIVKKLIQKLEVKCDFEREGCLAREKLENIHNHENTCVFNPNIEKTCDTICGLTMTSTEYRNHDCMKKLAKLVLEQRKEITHLKQGFRSLINSRKWQNGRTTINENNIIYYPKPNTPSQHETQQDIDNSRSKYPLNEINNYFEVKILNLGTNKVIVVVLSCKDYPSDRLPGWNQGSIAYHGKIDMIFIKYSVGHIFGPIWDNGDVIGCGIKIEKNNNIRSGESVVVYFKRNNIIIGERTIRVPDGGFYPSIGIRKSFGARIHVNFV